MDDGILSTCTKCGETFFREYAITGTGGRRILYKRCPECRPIPRNERDLVDIFSRPMGERLSEIY